MALTIAAVADAKNIRPEKIQVQIDRQTTQNQEWETHFITHIDLGKGLTRREQTILFNAARHCEVHKLLSGKMSFEYRLI